LPGEQVGQAGTPPGQLGVDSDVAGGIAWQSASALCLGQPACQTLLAVGVCRQGTAGPLQDRLGVRRVGAGQGLDLQQGLPGGGRRREQVQEHERSRVNHWTNPLRRKNVDRGQEVSHFRGEN
jgi:hypothetical protein